jgi:hypothetical protein
MMGGGLAGAGAGAAAEAETLIEKGASEVRARPSLTLMMMFLKVPTFVLLGVPESWPVAELKLAHDGFP